MKNSKSSIEEPFESLIQQPDQMGSQEPNHPTVKRGHYSVLESNVIFLVLAGIFLTVGAYVQSRSVLSGLLITEYGIILAPVIIYSLLTKKNIKKVFRLKVLPLKAIFKIIGIAFTLLPIIAVANLLVIWLIEHLSKTFDVGLPSASTSSEYLVLMFVISITAGICEESLFRGVVLDAYETAFGLKWGALFSGLLFGIFHFNPQNLLGPIILGIVFAYIVQVTGSIWAGVIAHAMNNGIAVTMGFLANLSSSEADILAAQNSPNMLFESNAIIAGVILFYGLFALLTSAGLFKLLKSLRNDFPRFEEGQALILTGNHYTFMEEREDVILLRNTEGEILQTDLKQLKRLKVKTSYKLWRERHKKLTFQVIEIIPLLLTLIVYGYIIYFAYF